MHTHKERKAIQHANTQGNQKTSSFALTPTVRVGATQHAHTHRVHSFASARAHTAIDSKAIVRLRGSMEVTRSTSDSAEEGEGTV